LLSAGDYKVPPVHQNWKAVNYKGPWLLHTQIGPSFDRTQGVVAIE